MLFLCILQTQSPTAQISHQWKNTTWKRNASLEQNKKYLQLKLTLFFTITVHIKINIKIQKNIIKRTMRTINHFVIRNGKVVSKNDAEKLPESQAPKLNIVKPASVIVRHLENKTNDDGIDQLSKMKKYYQNIIQGYEDKVRVLERQLFDKNELIAKLSKEKIMYMQSQAASTARDSRQSRFTLKQENQRISFDYMCLNQAQVRLNTLQNVSRDQQKQNNAQYQITDLNKKYPQQQYGAADNFKLPDLPAISSMSSICSVSSVTESVCESENVLNQNNNQQHEVKTFFDTSTLMARLNKSASLVRNIKKFLQPTATSPKSIRQSPSSPQSDPTQPESTQIPNADLNATNQQESNSYYEIQLQKFIDELVEKHEQILILLQQITTEKDQELKQTKNYYEQIIGKMQFQRVCGNGCGSKKNVYNQINRSMLKIISQGGVQGKENNKSKQKFRDKSVDKLLISTNKQTNQRVPLQKFKSRYEQNEPYPEQIQQQQ